MPFGESAQVVARKFELPAPCNPGTARGRLERARSPASLHINVKLKPQDKLWNERYSVQQETYDEPAYSSGQSG
ncbi:hypothetical protein N7495_004985 [Penicillium taxi]|uniref:uncharacterized protein n=1 Tax=Penicillium taxi TaxID=168475 RepID=UPI002545A83D|nr:uncharacterized protein N7495_004985 [Penicillium taxi]KAJ5893294.1 hypothetical protein N7495_004985 [Penicillium taxi]